MPAKWMPNDVSELISLYAEGQSAKSLGTRYGVSPSTIRKELRKQGVQLRSHLDAMGIAIPGWRGKSIPQKVREKIASTKQERLSHISAGEQELTRLLNERGVTGLIPQQAVGRYNIDVGAKPVAIEVFGGGWHSAGAHRRRTTSRYRFLLEHGWAVLVIWCIAEFKHISKEAADYAAAYIAEVRADASLLGAWRAIRADGVFISQGRSELDRIAWTAPTGRNKDWAALRVDGRVVRHHNAKLNDASVAEIHKQRALGLSYRKIAENIGVSHGAVRLVLLGKTWKQYNKP
jgi:transposase